MKKRLIIGLIALLLLSTYKIQNSFNFGSIVNIQNVKIENNKIIQKTLIKEKLIFLYNSNLFLLNKKLIKEKMEEIDLIKGYELKKVYPNKIKIKIFEKKPIAIIQNKKKRKFYTLEGDIINYFEHEKFNNLPLVFGDGKNFRIFHNNLKSINFPTNIIKSLYYFETKRWDLVTNKNQIIKLPIENYKASLKNFLILAKNKNFKKYKTFDYRINNQLILK